MPTLATNRATGDTITASDLNTIANTINTGTRVLSLAADITTTSTTIVDATGMLVSVAVGVWVVDAYLIVASSSTTQGPRFAIGGAATMTVNSFTVEQATSATARTTTIGTAANTGYGTNMGASNTNFACNIHCRVNVTVAGTLGLRWLESGTSTGTIRAGSYLTITTGN